MNPQEIGFVLYSVGTALLAIFAYLVGGNGACDAIAKQVATERCSECGVECLVDKRPVEKRPRVDKRPLAVQPKIPLVTIQPYLYGKDGRKVER